MRFRTRSLGFRLALSFGSILLLMVGMAAWVYEAVEEMGLAYSEALQTRTASIAASGRIAELTAKKDAAVRRYLVSGSQDDYVAIDKASLSLDQAILAVRPYVGDGTEAAVVYSDMISTSSDLQNMHNEVLGNWKLNRERAMERLTATGTVYAKLDQAVTQFNQLQAAATEKALTELDDQAQRTRWLTTGMAAAAVLIGIVAAVRVVRQVMRPVHQVAAAARRLAEGDLTEVAMNVAAKDEIGEMARSVATALANLRAAMAAVAESTMHVSEAADQLSSTADQAARASQEVAGSVSQIASRAQDQTGSVAQATEAMDSLQAAVAQIARGAGEQAGSVQGAADDVNRVMGEMDAVSAGVQTVSSAAARATQVAQSGSQVVGQTVQGIRDLQAAVHQAADQVKALGEASRRIGEITSVITEISDQTSLLALNAAIEAARAGEAGRGFAVVADEVRKLADRSVRSSADIGELVAAIQKGISGVIAAMETGSVKATFSVELAESTGKALTEIQQAVDMTNHGMQEITRAVAKVTESGRRMVDAMGSVAAVAEENSASAEEMAAGAEQVVNTIVGVADGARDTAAAAEEVSAAMEEITASNEEIAASAQMLTAAAEGLRSALARFRM